MADELNNGYPPIGGGPSIALQGENRNSIVYRDEAGYEYHMNWEVRGTRYLRCARRYAGCRVTARMGLEPGAPIILGNHEHTHHPRSLDVRLFLNTLRERGGRENATPAQIYNEVAPQNVRAAVVVGRPAAIRTIARARRRLSPPIPESLQEWADTLNHPEWRERLMWCNGTNNRFFQGRLDILDGGVPRFAGLVFANSAFLRSNNFHFSTVHTICIDGTYQVRPNHPADIAQLITVQVVLNNVAIPIVHGLLVDSTTESYCRFLQFLRNDLQLNFEYQNLRVITDFEQGLRNAVMMVMPESMNTGCWFHYIRSIIRFIRSNHLVRLCNSNANARRIVRMLMALPHLPSDMVEYRGNQFSISLGFLNIRNLVNQYNLNNDLNVLIVYFQHYWMDIVGPPRFSVYRLRHRTNNFIESYHASLLRRMGQHPPLYVFYDHLRNVEQQSRMDFSRAIDGLPVRRVTSRMYPQNMVTLNDAWLRAENGHYTLDEFQRYTAHTPEQILMAEIGEPVFVENDLQDLDLNLQALPPPLQLMGDQMIPEERGRRRRGQGGARIPENEPGPQRIRGRGGIHPRRGQRANRGRGQIDNRGRGQVPRGLAAQAWAEFFAQLSEDDEDIQPQLAPVQEPIQEDIQPQLAPVQEPIQEDIQPQLEPVQEPIQENIVEICIICMDEEVSVLLIPCRHKFCLVCVLRLQREAFEDLFVCPLCRRNVGSWENL